MAVTTAKIRAREAETGKKAYTGIDNSGNLHYAFDNATLQSILTKANNQYNDSQSAKALQQSYAMSNFNNQFNAAQAQNQMDFQERMSSTSHQREVKDLIAAGLNPVLSANSGASSPAGASASADTSTSTSAMQKEQLRQQAALAQLNAGVQLEINKQNIQSAKTMARWQNELNRELSYASLQNQQAVANIQAAASAYAANTSASASRYSVDNPNSWQGQLIKLLDGSSNSAKNVSSLQKRGKDIFENIESFLLGLRTDKKKASDMKKYGY